MTDYRLEMNAQDADRFEFCFLCGSPMVASQPTPDVVHTSAKVCSKNPFHVRIDILAADYDLDEGPEFK